GFNPYANGNGGGGINPYGTGGFNPYANGNGGGGINPYGTGGFNPYANGGGGFNPYGPGMINGGLGVSVGPGYPNNGGYWGATGGPNGANGYGVPGMGQDYYNQQQQQMQAQMAMQGQAAAGYSRMQGNASVNQMANSALYQNYANAGADLYGRGGAGYYGGAPYAAGNLGGQFGINAGVSFALGM
ncbi:MAG: hypothetical protein KBD76_15745, partial [Bacteriovorax sp.]|nr:hypothetical protein [Bacteriovorax sp.]